MLDDRLGFDLEPCQGHEGARLREWWSNGRALMPTWQVICVGAIGVQTVHM